MTQLILIRGLPGSGKSTLARIIRRFGYIHIETDQFWGEDYNFDISRIKEAHEWCQNRTKTYLKDGMWVIVANTFTTKKEMRPYFEMAKELDVKVQVILCQGQWENIHNVPEQVLEKMKNRFEYDISELFNETRN